MFDVAIVGGGPAAAAVLRGLNGAGRVAIVDAGSGSTTSSPHLPDDKTWLEWRQSDDDQWKILVGQHGQSLDATPGTSPKFRIPHVASIFAASRLRAGFQPDQFAGPVALALGGLSNFWGGGVAFFNESDISDWPIRPDELARYYKSEAEAVGICGSTGADLGIVGGTGVTMMPAPEMHPLAEGVYRSGKTASTDGYKVRPALNAVSTMPHNGRMTCNLSGACMLSCPRGAIYNAAGDLEEQFRHKDAVHIAGVYVQRFMATEEGYRLQGRDEAGKNIEISARLVVLAAGAIGSAALVMRSQPAMGRECPLRSTPAAGFGLFFPLHLGRAATPRFFGLGQFVIETALSEEHDDKGFGYLFCTEGMVVSSLLDATGLPKGDARRLMRLMLPSMLLGSYFFPSRFTDHRIQLNDDGRVRVSGRMTGDLAEARLYAQRQISRLARRSFGMLVPGGLRLAPAGADVHYAASLPHRKQPALGETFPDGRLAGMDGVYVADGAVLPSLPAKSHTLTIMANAHRIADHVRRRLDERNDLLRG